MARLIKSKFIYDPTKKKIQDDMLFISSKIRANLEEAIKECGGNPVIPADGSIYPTGSNISYYEFPDGGAYVSLKILKQADVYVINTQVGIIGSDRLWQPGDMLPGSDLVERIVSSLRAFPEGNEIVFDGISRQVWKKEGLIAQFQVGTYMPKYNPPK